jgi:hypothetical protein
MLDKNFLKPEQVNNLKEGEELFIQLVQKALEGKQSNFEFIKC